MSEWQAFERLGRTRKVTRIIRRRESPPIGWREASSPPTADEIAVAEANEKAHADARAAHAAFVARPEYAIANAIRDRLELMTFEDNPLDRLSLKEWSDLRDLICWSPS